jgi:septum formation protein
VPDIEELVTGVPEEIALENAERKARAIDAGGRLVLGVDTLVALDGTVYGKPADAREARTTLRTLSGREHAVIGGLCLRRGEESRTGVATTLVRFRTLDDALIDAYLDTGEWRDRAGAYAIQGRGAALVERIEGDYFNVVGLPVALLLELEPGLVG